MAKCYGFRLLFFSVASVAALPSPPLWRRRAATGLGISGYHLWSDVAKAETSEEVLSAGGNADSPWNKPRTEVGFAWSVGVDKGFES